MILHLNILSLKKLKSILMKLKEESEGAWIKTEHSQK